MCGRTARTVRRGEGPGQPALPTPMRCCRGSRADLLSPASTRGTALPADFRCYPWFQACRWVWRRNSAGQRGGSFQARGEPRGPVRGPRGSGTADGLGRLLQGVLGCLVAAVGSASWIRLLLLPAGLLSTFLGGRSSLGRGFVSGFFLRRGFVSGFLVVQSLLGSGLRSGQHALR